MVSRNARDAARGLAEVTGQPQFLYPSAIGLPAAGRASDFTSLDQRTHRLSKQHNYWNRLTVHL